MSKLRSRENRIKGENRGWIQTRTEKFLLTTTKRTIIDMQNHDFAMNSLGECVLTTFREDINEITSLMLSPMQKQFCILKNGICAGIHRFKFCTSKYRSKLMLCMKGWD